MKVDFLSGLKKQRAPKPEPAVVTEGMDIHGIKWLRVDNTNSLRVIGEIEAGGGFLFGMERVAGHNADWIYEVYWPRDLSGITRPK